MQNQHALNEISISYLFPPSLRDHLMRGDVKTARTRGSGIYSKTVFNGYDIVIAAINSQWL